MELAELFGLISYNLPKLIVYKAADRIIITRLLSADLCAFLLLRGISRVVEVAWILLVGVFLLDHIKLALEGNTASVLLEILVETVKSAKSLAWFKVLHAHTSAAVALVLSELHMHELILEYVDYLVLAMRALALFLRIFQL